MPIFQPGVYKFLGTNADGDGGGAFSNLTSGTNNLSLGYDNLIEVTSGNYNIGLGASALWTLTDGNSNIGIGSDAGGSVVDGDENIAIGNFAMDNNNTTLSGNANIAIGSYAAYGLNLAAEDNIAIGRYALADGNLTENSQGISNVCIGTFSGGYISSGYNNVCLGRDAGKGISSGYENIAIGYGSLIGLSSGGSITGNENISIGTFAHYSNITGSHNICIGETSGEGLENGDYNIFIGSSSLFSLASGLTGNYNIVIGGSAGPSNNTTSLDELLLIGAGCAGAIENGSTDLCIVGHHSAIRDNLAANRIGVFTDICCFGSNSLHLPDNISFSFTVDFNNIVTVGRDVLSNASFAALTANRTIDSCVFVGNNIQINSDVSASNRIVIGNDITSAFDNSIAIGSAPTKTNQVMLGADTQTVWAMGGLIAGDPGAEDTGITVNGVTYESTFKVSDIDGTNYAQTILHRHSTTLEPLIVGARSNSNTSAHSDVTNGMTLFSVYGVGYAGNDYKIFGTISIGVDSVGTISNTSAPGKFTVNLTPDGAAAPAFVFSIENNGKLTFQGTNTATVGAVTINKTCGRVNVAAAATSIVVTNSLVTANSHVLAVVSSNDATAQVKNVVPAAGSFTINLTAATDQTSIDFFVFDGT